MAPFVMALQASAAFSPTDIANLEIWLDAADESTITDTSGEVDQWNDKSGNARHVYAGPIATATTGLRTMNSLNALDFSGLTTDEVLNTSTGVVLTQPFTMFVVSQADTDSDRIIGSLGNGDVFFQVQDTDFYTVYAGTLLTDSTAYAHIPVIVRGVVNGANSNIGVNGGAGTTGNAGTNSLTLLQVGANGTSILEFDGLICEVLVYGRALNSTEIGNVETHLGTKWGITLA